MAEEPKPVDDFRPIVKFLFSETPSTLQPMRLPVQDHNLNVDGGHDIQLRWAINSRTSGNPTPFYGDLARAWRCTKSAIAAE